MSNEIYDNLDGVLQMIYEHTMEYKIKSTPPHVPLLVEDGIKGR